MTAALPGNPTETRLLDAALTLFAAKGYAATSVREIIAAAGVTRPVLYYYHASKEALFVRLVRWKHDEAYRALGEAVQAADGCAARLRAIVRGSFAFCAADPRVPRLMFQTAYGPPLPEIAGVLDGVAQLRFAIVHEVMRAGLAAGELGGGDAAALTLAFCCLMDGHLNVLSRQDATTAALTAERADALVDLFLHGAGVGRRQTVTLPPLAGE